VKARSVGAGLCFATSLGIEDKIFTSDLPHELAAKFKRVF